MDKEALTSKVEIKPSFLPPSSRTKFFTESPKVLSKSRTQVNSASLNLEKPFRPRLRTVNQLPLKGEPSSLPKTKPPTVSQRDVTHLKDSFLTRSSSYRSLSKLQDASFQDSLRKYNTETGEIPSNLFFGTPTGRQEVNNLIEWFRDIKKETIDCILNESKLNDKPLEDQEKDLKNAEGILTTGINEIIRQVTVDCRERGMMLKEIVQCFYQYYNICQKVSQFNLVKQISGLQQRTDLMKRMYENKENTFMNEIEELKSLLNEKQFIVEMKEDEIKRLKNSVKQLESSKLLVKDERKEVKSENKLQLKPFYSRNDKDNLLQAFFSTSATQTKHPNLKTKATAMKSLIHVSAEVQTEEFNNIETINSSCDLEKDELISQRFSDSEEVPNTIIVTTDKNERIIEYALVPNKNLLPPTALHSIKDPWQQGTSDVPEPDELSEIQDPTFSNLSASSSDSESSGLLIVPEIQNTSLEEPKKHSLNPDPFTDIVPSESAYKNQSKLKRRTVRMSHKKVQTDRDILLENEEREIVDQMINYKNELLRKTDQELVLAKSKLVGLKRQVTLQENEMNVPEEIQGFEEFLRGILNQERQVDTQSFKRGFVYGYKCKHNDYQNQVKQLEQEVKKKTSPIRKMYTQVFSKMPEKLTMKSKRKNSHAFTLLQNLKEKTPDLDKYNSLSKKLLLKKLFLVYGSAVSKQNSGEVLPSMAEFLYEYIQSRHQDSLMGDKRYLEIVSAALRNKDHSQSVIFLRLIGMGSHINTENFTRPEHSFKFFVRFLALVGQSNAGITISHHNTGETQYIPKLRAIECIKDIFGEMLPSAYIDHITSAIEKVSKADPMKINKNGIVNQDYVLDLLMDEYEKHSKPIVDAVNLISQGFDIYKTGRVHISEIILIIRHLAPDKLNLVLNRTGEISDHMAGLLSKMYISLEDLTQLFIHKAVLSMKNIETYLTDVPMQQAQAIDAIRSMIYKSIPSFNKVTQHKEELGITPEVEEIWRSKLKALEGDLQIHPKAAYLAFTLFVDEMKRLEAFME